jgi:hypothetical protein
MEEGLFVGFVEMMCILVPGPPLDELLVPNMQPRNVFVLSLGSASREIGPSVLLEDPAIVEDRYLCEKVAVGLLSEVGRFGR